MLRSLVVLQRPRDHVALTADGLGVDGQGVGEPGQMRELLAHPPPSLLRLGRTRGVRLGLAPDRGRGGLGRFEDLVDLVGD